MAQTANKTDQNESPSTQVQLGKTVSDSLPSRKNRNRVLFRTTAVWIVDLFPDELVVQEKTISVIRKYFLMSFVETMPVKDIGRVVFINTPFFGGLRVIGKNTAHELRIKGLRKKEALEGKDIIEGLLLEDEGVVDIPYWLDKEEKRDALADAGRDPTHDDELDDRAI